MLDGTSSHAYTACLGLLGSVQDTHTLTKILVQVFNVPLVCTCAGFRIVVTKVMDHHNLEGCTCSVESFTFFFLDACSADKDYLLLLVVVLKRTVL